MSRMFTGTEQHDGRRQDHQAQRDWLGSQDDQTVERYLGELDRLAVAEPLVAAHDREIELSNGRMPFSPMSCPLCRRFAELEQAAAAAVGYVDLDPIDSTPTRPDQTAGEEGAA